MWLGWWRICTIEVLRQSLPGHGHLGGRAVIGIQDIGARFSVAVGRATMGPQVAMTELLKGGVILWKARQGNVIWANQMPRQSGCTSKK